MPEAEDLRRGRVILAAMRWAPRVVALGVVAAAGAAGAAHAARGASLATARKVPVKAGAAEYSLNVDDRAATFTVAAPTRAAVEAGSTKHLATPLYPSFAAAEGEFLPSLELCRWRGLAFEEGLAAAVEGQLEKATGDLAGGRPGFLTALALRLKQAYEADDRAASRSPFADALSFVATALALLRPDGKIPPELGLPEDIATRALQDKKKFVAEDIFARRAAGYYLWREELQRVYLCERWLGQKWERGDPKQFKMALALSWAVGRDEELSRGYRLLTEVMNLLSGNAPTSASATDYYALLAGRDAPTVLREAGTVQTLQVKAKDQGDAFVFLAALEPPQVRLLRDFVAHGDKGKAASWAAAFVEAARAQEPPPPAADASWSTYMNYAGAVLLSPAAAPAARKISWDDNYRARLGASFVRAFDQIRVRAAKPPAPPAPAGDALDVDVTPEFRLEPLPEYYLRLARAYRRLARALPQALTPAAVAAMRGEREGGGAASAPLAEELAATRDLFYGLYLLSCADIGMTPAVTYGEVPARAAVASRAAAWLADWKADPDMARDVREIWALGPADAAAPEKGTVYRCVLGVRALDIDVTYDRKPSFFLLGTSRSANLHFKPAKYTVLVPVVVEVVVPGEKPLSRREFRKICDENKTRDAIVAALVAFGKVEEPPATAAAPAPPPARSVDSGMVVLIVVLGVFALIVIVAIIAGRRRY